MAAALPDVLRQPIADFEAAKAWIAALVDADLDFHFEDGPAEQINFDTGEDVFAPDDVPVIAEQVDRLYEFGWGDYECPIGYMLERIDLRDALPAGAA